jgi:hypothetical protein
MIFGESYSALYIGDMIIDASGYMYTSIIRMVEDTHHSVTIGMEYLNTVQALTGGLIITYLALD